MSDHTVNYPYTAVNTASETIVETTTEPIHTKAQTLLQLQENALLALALVLVALIAGAFWYFQQQHYSDIAFAGLGSAATLVSISYFRVLIDYKRSK